MANKTINAITPIEGSLSSNDLFVIWDTDEESTRSVTTSDLLNAVQNLLFSENDFGITDEQGMPITSVNGIINYIINEIRGESGTEEPSIEEPSTEEPGTGE